MDPFDHTPPALLREALNALVARHPQLLAEERAAHEAAEAATAARARTEAAIGHFQGVLAGASNGTPPAGTPAPDVAVPGQPGAGPRQAVLDALAAGRDAADNGETRRPSPDGAARDGTHEGSAGRAGDADPDAARSSYSDTAPEPSSPNGSGLAAGSMLPGAHSVWTWTARRLLAHDSEGRAGLTHAQLFEDAERDGFTAGNPRPRRRIRDNFGRTLRDMCEGARPRLRQEGKEFLLTEYGRGEAQRLLREAAAEDGVPTAAA